MARLNRESVIASLQKAPLFAGMDSHLLGTLASCCRFHRYGPEHVLFYAGDPGYTLYVIVRGTVNIQSDTAFGQVIHHARRGAGDVIGEMALLTGNPRTNDAVVTEECELLALDRNDFLHCVERSPQLALNIIACLADRLVEAGKRLERRQGLDVTGRLAQSLLDLADLHGTEPAEGGGQRIKARLTDEQLAERIGSTRATVNRKLAEMESLNVIRKESRQITIRNLAWLKQRAAE